MKYLVTAKEMQQYDGNTTERIGISGTVLMERAALAALQEIKGYVQERKPIRKTALVLVGMGNNGGDGLALARLLSEEAFQVEVWCVGDEARASKQWKQQFAILSNYPVRISSKPSQEEYTILIDALFGVGLSRPLEGKYARAIEGFNCLAGYKVALDIPSGISADTGEVLGTAAKVDLTVAFGFLKRGHVLYPGCSYCGRIKEYPIGIGARSFFGEYPQMFCYDEPVSELLPDRSPAGNKGTFGKVLLIAGGFQMAGAAVLSGTAAYRVGAGMVKVITVAENREILQTGLPEALLGGPDDLEESMEWADVIAIGPGLSTGREASEMLEKVLYKSRLPLVLDADALNLLAEREALQEEAAEQGKAGRAIILTPHAGELSRLLKLPVSQLKENLSFYGKTLAEKLHAVVVAKDARSFICKEEYPVCVNCTGNSGMATAGSGDVLTGIIAGLLAQGMQAFEAASVGAYLHGRAGELAAKKKGEYSLTAGDLIAEAILNRLA